ncbi:MAG: peptidoglycan DD-metalloendopeptidase family protein [Bdellovibrionota bacterium]
MLGLFLTVIGISFLISKDRQQPAKIEQPLSTPAIQATIEMPPPEVPWTEHTIEKGESLAIIFSNLGLSPAHLHQVTQEIAHPQELEKLLPGKKLNVRINQEQLLELIYEKNESEYFHITQVDHTFTSSLVQYEYTPVIKTAHVVIEDSLFLSGRRAGLSQGLIMELAEIFAWDIDFTLDIRSNDKIDVLFVEKHKDGIKFKDGPILAAEFHNQGRVIQAYRYEVPGQGTQYYDKNGKSMRKSFLRSPIDFARVSSNFNLRRKHPVLNKIRAHRGVDYAANRGTPIKATSHGTIEFKGQKGGYGNTIIIRHGSSYSTLYAHLSKFANGIYKNARVKQGQVIGYVGSTGLATGPHLHYEFRIGGKHKNPLKVKFPEAYTLSQEELTTFQQASAQMDQKLRL